MILRWLTNKSLSIKFNLMVITILIITTSTVTYIDIRSQHQLHLNSLIAKGRALGHFVSLISPHLVLSYDFEGMNDYMREISREQDVVYGVLIAENNINLTDYLNDKNNYIVKARETYPKVNVIQIVKLINSSPEIISIEFPILLKKQKLGRLLIGMSRKKIDANFKKDLVEMLLANAAIITFLSVCIYIGFRFMTMKPIKNLRAGLQQVAEGDLKSRVNINANDEIGSLTNSFNDMASHLELTISEKDDIAKKYKQQANDFLALNESLQSRVQESTHIMRDLHDDVGAKLLTLVHRSESTKNEETARAALKDLRETIRGLGKNETTVYINDALDDWREEVTDRLEAAKIELIWQQPDDLPEKLLNNRQLINISRILREAISNSIRHGIPKKVEVSIFLENGIFKMTICNDTLDIDIDNWEAGTGMNNINTRANELGAKIRWFIPEKKAASNLDTNSNQQTPNKTILQNSVCVEVICPFIEEF